MKTKKNTNKTQQKEVIKIISLNSDLREALENKKLAENK